MGQKTALLITAGLTIFVLGMGGLLARNLTRQPEAPLTAALPVAASDSATVETLLARDVLYQARLTEANQTIQQANTALVALQAEQSALASQNQMLLQREAAYRQAIEQANALLQQQASMPQVIVASAPAPAPAAPAYADEYYEEHENEEGDDD